jgi:hypothetical protein
MKRQWLIRSDFSLWQKQKHIATIWFLANLIRTFYNSQPQQSDGNRLPPMYEYETVKVEERETALRQLPGCFVELHQQNLRMEAHTD